MPSIDTLEITGVVDTGTGFPIGVRTHERPPRFLSAPFVLAQDFTSSAPVTGTLAETTVSGRSINIPGGLLGPNGSMRIWAHFFGTNNANSKICQIKFAGQNISGTTLNMANNLGVAIERNFANRGALNLNRWFGSSSVPAGAGMGITMVDLGIDTSRDQSITFTVQLGVDTDSVVLAGYRVEIFPSE